MARMLTAVSKDVVLLQYVALSFQRQPLNRCRWKTMTAARTNHSRLVLLTDEKTILNQR